MAAASRRQCLGLRAAVEALWTSHLIGGMGQVRLGIHSQAQVRLGIHVQYSRHLPQWIRL